MLRIQQVCRPYSEMLTYMLFYNYAELNKTFFKTQKTHKNEAIYKEYLYHISQIYSGL
jgi:hypothetical protein